MPDVTENAALTQIDLTPLAEFGLDLDQYFGLWAAEHGHFMAVFGGVADLDLAAHVRARQAAGGKSPGDAPKIEQDGAIGLLDITGTLTKRGSSLSSAGSLIELRHAVRQAAADESIAAILLRIDSPGGTVAGTADLAAEVVRARAQKPVWAFCDDLCASAAYWVASQCSAVYANTPTAMIGSIGTYVGLYDLSGAAEKEGAKPVLIKAGEFKGAGFPGTEITDAQKAVWQGLVDQTQAEFTAAVVSGRKLSTATVEALADGRVHLASVAEQLGLIDGIATFEETFSRLSAQIKSSRSKNRRTSTMTEATTTPQAASFQERKAALPNAESDFICAQMEASATVEQANSAYTRALEVKNKAQQEAHDKQLAEQQAKLDKANDKAEKESKARKFGVDPLGHSRSSGDGEGDGEGEGGGDPVAEFGSRVRKRVADGMTRRKAVIAVVNADKELHHRYLKATNANRSKVQSLIDERAEM